MSHPSTLFRFRIQVSDIDRGYYDALDLRIAQHPSENEAFLLTRVIAYALNFTPGLDMSPGGLADPDKPALQIPSAQGGSDLWIEIGNPSARKLHKASKAARVVKVYTYKDARNLLREMAAGSVHRASEIEVYSLQPSLLEALSATLKRDNTWNLTHAEGSLVFNVGDETFEGELTRHVLSTSAEAPNT